MTYIFCFFSDDTNEWKDVEVDILASEFAIVFVANGDHDRVRGGIALDDIQLVPGGCAGNTYEGGDSDDSGDDGDNTGSEEGSDSDGGQSEGNRPSRPEVEDEPSDRSGNNAFHVRLC